MAALADNVDLGGVKVGIGQLIHGIVCCVVAFENRNGGVVGRSCLVPFLNVRTWWTPSPGGSATIESHQG